MATKKNSNKKSSGAKKPATSKVRKRPRKQIDDEPLPLQAWERGESIDHEPDESQL